MVPRPERDIEKDYPLTEFVAKLRRLADAIERGEQFEIQVASQRIYVPVRATTSSMSAARMKRSSNFKSNGRHDDSVGTYCARSLALRTTR
jgi:phage terminase large subunit-like protein